MNKEIEALKDIVLGPVVPYQQTITTTGTNIDMLKQMKDEQKRRYDNAQAFIDWCMNR